MLQTLREHDPTGQDVEKLGTVEVTFERGALKSDLGPQAVSKARAADLVGPVSERAKKALGAVTK